MNGNLGSQTSGNYWQEAPPVMLYDEHQETHAVLSPKHTQIFVELEDQMTRFEAEHEALINEVSKYYVVMPDSLDFCRRHRALPQLLLEAVSHLREHFGIDAVFNLRAPIDESGEQTLYVVAMWPGKIRNVRNALERFDDTWWIANSRRAHGDLTFTYELV